MHCLKASVTKRWFLKQLNTLSVSGKKSPRTNQVDGHVWEDNSKGVVWRQWRLDLQD